ncbi:MAG: glycosyltransferase family 4 protein [Granulosicoccus sp.]|nr:glycosyltransferase family 4 protein [Granulosicoccus sp.]
MSNTLEFRRKLVVVVKGYPRLSETFIAQELLGLEKAGIELAIVSLRQPTDLKTHAINDEINAAVTYLPEYVHRSPLRVLRGLLSSARQPGFVKAFRHFLRDLKNDLSRNRVRRFCQAAVLASEWPVDGQWLHAHFIHTPASVANYASIILGIPWTVSAHAKDIWTSKDWELREKLATARWAVTCTKVGHQHLQSLATDASSVHLSYHGLDLTRFPAYDRPESNRDGNAADNPVVILSVGRAVEKKGFDILLAALALLPAKLNWRFVHIGGGTELPKLKALAEDSHIEDRISWLGATDQKEVLVNYQQADVFALACRITADGDRDGLPNVLLEAASQGLACVSTRVSGIPEFFDNENGLIVESEDSAALATALEQVITSPALRNQLGKTAQVKLRSEFDYHNSINQLVDLFDTEWRNMTK